MSTDQQALQGFGYNNGSWVNSTGRDMHEYSHFDSSGSAQARLPIYPSYGMARSPPCAAGVPQMPPSLFMPQSGMWPSIIATGGHPATFQQPIPVPVPIPSADISSDPRPTSAKTTISRRKLTDQERQKICLEAEQNPQRKQYQIAGMSRLYTT